MSTAHTIARAAAVIAVFTLLSKVLGFCREVALANSPAAAFNQATASFLKPFCVFCRIHGIVLSGSRPISIGLTQIRFLQQEIFTDVTAGDRHIVIIR